MVKQLRLLEKQGAITLWSRDQVAAGENRMEEISRHFEAARVILVLISSDYMNSNELFDGELRHALARQSAGSARIIPILLRPCDVTRAPFYHLDVLPRGQRPITTWLNRDAALAEVARDIRRLCVDLFREAGADVSTFEEAAPPQPASADLLAEYCSRATRTRIAALQEGGRYQADTFVQRPEAMLNLEAFRGGNRSLFYLVGQSGAGKTHLVLQFAEACLNRGDAVLFCSLPSAMPDEAASREGIERFLMSQAGLQGSFASWLDVWHEEMAHAAPPRHLVLILDQFDRVGGATYSQKRLFAALCDLAEAHRSLRIILPVRIETNNLLAQDREWPAGIDAYAFDPGWTEEKLADLPPFANYLPPFDEEQLCEAIQRWSAALGCNIEVEKIPPSWRVLLRTPIYLCEYMRVLARGGCAPNGDASSANLYRQVIDGLPEKTKEVVYKLAGLMNRDGSMRLTMEEAQKVAPQLTPNSSVLNGLIGAGIVNRVQIRTLEGEVWGLEFSHDRIFEFIIQNHRAFLAKKFYQSARQLIAITCSVGAFALCVTDASARISQIKANLFSTLSGSQNALGVNPLGEGLYAAQIGWVYGMHSATALLEFVMMTLIAVVGYVYFLALIRWQDDFALARMRKGKKGLESIRGTEILALLSMRQQAWIPKDRYYFGMSAMIMGETLIFWPKQIGLLLEGAQSWSSLVGVSTLVVMSFLLFGLAWEQGEWAKKLKTHLQARAPDERLRLVALLSAQWSSPGLLGRRLVGWILLSAVLTAAYVGFFQVNYWKDVLLTQRTVAQMNWCMSRVEADGQQNSHTRYLADWYVKRRQQSMEFEIIRYRDEAFRPLAFGAIGALSAVGMLNLGLQHLVALFLLRRLRRAARGQ